MAMTTEQRFWWHISLELKLRKSSGDAFQDFFSDVMGKAHGSDFVRVRPFGRVGDKGCDGYLLSSGKVFQCYGAMDTSTNKVAYLIGKMVEDFDKAKKSLPAIMKEWHMAHNFVDGLPTDALLTLNEIQAKNPNIKCAFFGPDAIENVIFGLGEEKIEDLLGLAATIRQSQSMQAAELRDLLNAVMATADGEQFDVTNIKPVPPEKLDYNKLPSHWRALISGGWQNAHLVAQYINQHIDPTMGEKIAGVFRARYGLLKSEGIAPGAIMSSLYEFITGVGMVPPERQVAAQALLAFLFESCDIFESVPPAAVQ